MPRHNNRKHYSNEGKLGFDPMKYIGMHPSRNGQTYRYPMRMEKKSDKNRFDRHKAHAPTKKQRRALAEIKQMHKNAELVWSEPTAPTTPTIPAPAIDY